MQQEAPRKHDSIEHVIEALQTAQEKRTPTMVKLLKTYAHSLPLMEGKYCSHEDYSYVVERLQYKFVEKGHYIVRQGEKGDRCYFILSGRANVLVWGGFNATYIDNKAMYNEIALTRIKKEKEKNLYKGMTLDIIEDSSSDSQGDEDGPVIASP